MHKEYITIDYLCSGCIKEAGFTKPGKVPWIEGTCVVCMSDRWVTLSSTKGKAKINNNIGLVYSKHFIKMCPTCMATGHGRLTSVKPLTFASCEVCDGSGEYNEG